MLIQPGANIHAVSDLGETATTVALFDVRRFIEWRRSLLEKPGFEVNEILEEKIEVLSPALEWT